MGHKVSAVSYWVYGCSVENNLILKEHIASSYSEDKQEQKKTKYKERYKEYLNPGFINAETEKAHVNRLFMYDNRNYRFEFGRLNSKHGSAERRSCSYSLMYEKGAKYSKEKYKIPLQKTTSYVKRFLSIQKARLLEIIKDLSDIIIKTITMTPKTSVAIDALVDQPVAVTSSTLTASVSKDSVQSTVLFRAPKVSTTRLTTSDLTVKASELVKPSRKHCSVV